MMEAVVIVMVVIAVFWIGVMLGAETNANSPKTKEFRTLDKMDDRELVLLFMAVGSELESRGLARSTDKNPFEDLDK